MKTETGNILVIDDDATNREVLTTQLQHLGHNVNSVASGLQALSMLEEFAFDAVLLDLHMPDLDGFQVLKRMKTSVALRHIPVLIVSMETEMQSILRCLETGAMDYLLKPVSTEILRLRVSAALMMKQMQDEDDAAAGKMLVVDDDAFSRELLAANLEESGYVVVKAEGGKQALEKLESHVFDVVFLDMIMPEIDGVEVLRRMKIDNRLYHVPVIVVSSDADMDSIARCIRMGATDYVVKPFNSALLHARTYASLAARRMRQKELVYFRLIQAERQRAERLLLNTLPKPIADRLKNGERVIAESYSDVSVLFADIVNFTPMSQRITAYQLVKLLNDVFSRFDALCENYGLEKIKTIGDAYMAVGGLPSESPDHVERIAEMAMDMKRDVAELGKKRGEALHVRIGINSGPVVAGVIGVTKFSYDLWGDTVNVASRMESQGVTDAIQVTQTIHDRLKSRYTFEERGDVEIKGKGAVRTWFLTGKKA